MRPYTVLLLRPDYIAEPYGQDTYMAHVEAENPVNAIEAAQIEVWNEDAGDEDSTSWDDYHPLLVLDGHLYDAGPLPHAPSPEPELKTYTVFCQERTGKGTIWIDTVQAVDPDEAASLGRTQCAKSWEFYDEDNVHVLGVATGDIEIVMWDDLNC